MEVIGGLRGTGNTRVATAAFVGGIVHDVNIEKLGG